jgi:hypothetical protein
MIRILKGCERNNESLITFSHPFRMQPSFPMVPGVYAALQPLATFCNPFGVKSCVYFSNLMTQD